MLAVVQPMSSLCGHPERRTDHGETDADVAAKKHKPRIAQSQVTVHW
jgi:triosephosphate isomerase